MPSAGLGPPGRRRCPAGSLSPPRSKVRKRDLAAVQGADHRHRVPVLLFLGRQIGPLEVEELGPEQPDRLGARIEGGGYLGQTLDVGGQVDLDAVGGLRGQRPQRPQVLAVGLLGRRQPLVGLPGRRIGIEDDLAAAPVDDHGVARLDPGRQLLEADHEGQAERLGQDRRVRGPAAPIGGEAHHAGALEREGIERRQVDAHRDRSRGRAVARPPLGQLAAARAAGGRRWHRRRRPRSRK